MNRRDLLKLAALSAVPTSLIHGRSAFAAGEALEFGCPVPMSGAFAANGKFADLGMRLALDQYGQVLGRPLRYSVLDTEGKPATAVRKV
ncbi:ABC transporter substrate-binding protein, partial [Cupriavidus consociatus]